MVTGVRQDRERKMGGKFQGGEAATRERAEKWRGEWRERKQAGKERCGGGPETGRQTCGRAPMVGQQLFTVQGRDAEGPPRGRVTEQGPLLVCC